MRSPWHDDESGNNNQDQHVLLGQILERSTSAPPISTEQHKLALMNERGEGGSRNFLFGTNNNNNSQGDSGLFSPSGRDSAPLQAWAGEEALSSSATSYPSTLLSDALLSSGLNDQRSMSAASRSQSMGGFSDHQQQQQQRSVQQQQVPAPRGSISFADDAGHPTMVRSQSAAPSFLNNNPRGGVGPPPGMSEQRRDTRDRYSGAAAAAAAAAAANNNTRQQHGMRRPASAGLINEEHHSSGSSVLASLGIDSRGDAGGAAVRPAPKTLMDLIQEDTTTPKSDAFGSYNGAPAGLGLTRSHTAGPSFYERDDLPGYGERARTASPSRYDTFGDNRFEQRGQPFQPEPKRFQEPQMAEPRNQPYQPEPKRFQESHLAGVTHQMDRLQVGHGGQQQYRMSPQEPQQAHGTQYVTIPVSQLQQRGPPSQMGQHQEPQRPQPRSMYAPAHQPQPQTVQHHQQFDQHGQPVYYANSQPGAPMGVEQGAPPPSNQTLTMATLPNGQTVYLNMTPYGYTPAQFPPAPPAHPQHAHLVHPQHQQVQHGHEYVSVMPAVQPGQQVAYYGGGGDGAPMGQTVIMSPHGGAPVMMQRGGGGGGAMQEAPPPRMKETADRGGPPKSANKARRGGGQASGRRDEARGGGGGGKHSVTSPLLDEFRATKNRDWTMLDIKGHVVEFCQDQNGSRFIQQRLEIGNASEQQVVMAEVLPAVRQLRNDVFGNYVVQKLLEFGTHPMKVQLRDTLKGEMLPLSLQMYGCRVVQKALETLDEDDLPKLLIEFHHNVLSCIHDQNGNHVIQKCIEVMSTKAKQAYSMHDGERAQFFGEQIDFIINDVLDNVTPLSCHPYGCRVLQRILEHCVEPKKVRALDEIAKCHKVLLDDQYGNYVIQHVLQYGRHEDRQSVIGIVIANGLLVLSKQKFASNVVEKLLKYGTPSQRNALVREMLKVVDDPNTGGSSVVLLMVRDAYANYVVQTTLDVVPEGEEKRLLLEELNAHSAQLRQYTFAKHIVTKLSS